MHGHAWDFVAQTTQYFDPPATVIEIGSRDVNGSIRPLFPTARYVGVDVMTGPKVDVVADGALVSLEVCGLAEPVDVAVCCEVLEHAENWRAIVANMARLVRPGGAVVITAAGPTRAPHSAFDGGAVRPGEYYGGVPLSELLEVCTAAGLEVRQGADRADRGDVYVYAERPAA